MSYIIKKNKKRRSKGAAVICEQHPPAYKILDYKEHQYNLY